MKIKNLKSSLKQIKNPPVDRGFLASLRERVKMQIQAFPPHVRNAELDRLNTKQRSQSLLINKFKTKTMIPAIISLIILLSGGGAAAASQNSLPGDVLYPIKNLTEDVRLAVTMDQKAKANLNIEFAQKRIEEIQKLLTASSTEQNANKAQGIQKALDNFNSHLEKVLANADNLKKENKLNDALDTINELTSSSDVYKKLLENEDLKLSRKELKDKIKSSIVAADANASSTDAIAKEIKDTEDKGINQNSAEGKIKAAENKIAEVEKFLDLKNGNTSSTTATSTVVSVASSTTILGEAKTKLQEAKNFLAAGDYKNAFQAARESMDLANNAKHADRLKKLDLKENEEKNNKNDEVHGNKNASSTDNEDGDRATSTEKSSESKKSDNEKSNGKNEKTDSND